MEMQEINRQAERDPSMYLFSDASRQLKRGLWDMSGFEDFHTPAGKQLYGVKRRSKTGCDYFACSTCFAAPMLSYLS